MTTLNSIIKLVLIDDSGVSYDSYILLVKVDADGHVCKTLFLIFKMQEDQILFCIAIYLCYWRNRKNWHVVLVI